MAVKDRFLCKQIPVSRRRRRLRRRRRRRLLPLLRVVRMGFNFMTQDRKEAAAKKFLGCHVLYVYMGLLHLYEHNMQPTLAPL